MLMFKKEESYDSHWLSIADLMAGLMMVFLFIAIALMRYALIERDKVKDVAVAYQENQVAIYDSLIDEFSNDLTRWDAKIDEQTLTFTFNSQDVLFESGSSELNPVYQEILEDFFPRYLAVLDRFDQSIDEIRIEGHTSNGWENLNKNQAYFKNMALSQDRTRAVLEYIYKLSSVEHKQQWMTSHMAAVGLSSAKAVFDENNIELKKQSRRVSFRVITNAHIQIQRILEQ